MFEILFFKRLPKKRLIVILLIGLLSCLLCFEKNSEVLLHCCSSTSELLPTGWTSLNPLHLTARFTHQVTIVALNDLHGGPHVL